MHTVLSTGYITHESGNEHVEFVADSLAALRQQMAAWVAAAPAGERTRYQQHIDE